MCLCQHFTWIGILRFQLGQTEALCQMQVGQGVAVVAPDRICPRSRAFLSSTFKQLLHVDCEFSSDDKFNIGAISVSARFSSHLLPVCMQGPGTTLSPEQFHEYLQEMKEASEACPCDCLAFQD
eukprot:3052695-Amphidinium_carterae.1